MGTQTFGSVIRPASYCGVFTLKPVNEAISRDGVIPLAWSLNHVGMFTRSAGLAALCAEVLFESGFGGERPGPVVKESRKTRRDRLHGATAGMPDRYFFDNIDPTTRRGYDAGIDALTRAGIRIREVEVPSLFEPAIAAARLILRVEAAAFHRQWYPARAQEYGPKLRSIIESGNRIPAVEYLQARQVQQAARRQMIELMEKMDVLVSPIHADGRSRRTFLDRRSGIQHAFFRCRLSGHDPSGKLFPGALAFRLPSSGTPLVRSAFTPAGPVAGGGGLRPVHASLF